MELIHPMTTMSAGSTSNPPNIHQPILRLDNISVRFQQTPALNNVSFALQRGERVAVIGPNGAGKSTLFNIISGLISPTQGQVEMCGRAPNKQVGIAYVPQRSRVDWQFPVTVNDVVMMGRVGRLGLFRWPKQKDRHIVEEALALVNMTDLAKRQIGELSGGQQQRVFIARALAQEAELMLMDEPLTGLDLKSQEGIFAILDKLRQRQVTIMVATHDLNVAAERFDRLLLLNQQVIGFGRAKEVFTTSMLSRTYQGSLNLIETPNGAMVMSSN
ncbi:metal ABC transporter ATP-binding protein [Anaerolineales bacterium HSG6]|nr:metal ABC transporter ATP-binding protein [Anaerolineales bacterium HSG6]MDM8529928.1 metal ABC transporter ATP-binding protein [Anaerolineales bacterium HSG25]